MKEAFIIAEIAQGFEGDVKLCKTFITQAKKVGAHAVKFQIFLASELCRKDYAYYDLFKGLEIPPTEWGKLVSYAKEIGIDFYADIFGLETLAWMMETDVKGIKIHGSDIKNYPLLEGVSKFNGTIILSLGGSELSEVEKALTYLKGKKVVLMSGFQGEPNQPEDVELNKIKYLNEKFKLDVGYADHIDADDTTLAISLPAMAYLNGASVIEKHLTIDRNNLQLEDYVSALNPSEFIQMVKLIKGVERFNHTTEYKLTEREREYRKNTKKVPVAKRNLTAGSVLTVNDIDLLRVGEEKPKNLLDHDQIIGKKLIKSLDAQSVIHVENLS
jgi:N,N'-diacetyllegionaminate synthase